MMIPVKIKFSGASLVLDNRDEKKPNKTDDYYVTLENCLKIRKTKDDFYCTPRNTDETLVMRDKDLIVKSPIVGMLHAMLGEIPPKRFGGFGIKPVQQIVDCVNNGVMKITNDYFYYDKNGNRVLITEVTQARKFKKSSRPEKPFRRKDYKGDDVEVHFTWVGLKKRFMKGNRRYNAVTYCEFLDKLESLTKLNCRDNSVEFSEVFDNIRNDINKKKEFLEFLTERDYRMYIHFLNDKSYNCKKTRFENMRDGIMVQRYIQERVDLDGEFVFWITEDMYDRLMRGPRSCRYLEGGEAHLSNDKCYTYDYYIDEGYIPIKNLND